MFNKNNRNRSKFLIKTRKFDKNIYDQLYTFDLDKELKAFTEPLEKKSKELENRNFLLKTQKRQKLARINDKRIVKEKTEIEKETETQDFEKIIDRVYKGKNKFKLNKV